MEYSLLYISLLFVITTALSVSIFYYAADKSRPTLFIIIAWLVFQAIMRISGIYNPLPPYVKFILLLVPPLLFIILVFITKKGKQYIDRMDTKLLTLIHIYRIPLEIILFSLYLNNTLPELIRPIYRNLEILAGVTAPIIYYFGGIKKFFNRKTILIWNIVCLVFLISVVLNTNLSSPFPLQKFMVDESKFITYFYFPIIWLPSFVTPLLFFCHLVTIRQLIYYKSRFE